MFEYLLLRPRFSTPTIPLPSKDSYIDVATNYFKWFTQQFRVSLFPKAKVK